MRRTFLGVLAVATALLAGPAVADDGENCMVVVDRFGNRIEVCNICVDVDPGPLPRVCMPVGNCPWEGICYEEP